MAVQPERISKLNDAPERPDRKYVLYWAQMNRRVENNHALCFAVEIANRLNLPVLVYEGLTCTYEMANDRMHTFILEAVPGTAARLKQLGIGFVFYLRRTPESRNDALYALAKDAAAIVTDDYPTFIARQHNRNVPAKLDVPYYVVDSSCVVPMGMIPGRQFAAYTIRPKIKKLLPEYLKPADNPQPKQRFERDVPPFHTTVTPQNIAALVASCAIDHSVKPSISFRGGYQRARILLDYFLEHNLARFERDRNEPSEHATSHMSPYLHFGQLSSLEIALAVKKYGEEHGLDSAVYLEELIVRRELSFNYARHTNDPGSLDNLPDWCQKTMAMHLTDPREHVYSYEQFERGETGDALWNATQKEMLIRGKIQGYYRMYWGKKILEWSPSYEDAARTMINIHTRYALDGRDPNTYTNVLWCFGLHDRPWFERPIFGKMRYMSLGGMNRKTDTEAYIAEIRRVEESGRDVSAVI
jgi:deoxyribodipyrimidine photo-lyase